MSATTEAPDRPAVLDDMRPPQIGGEGACPGNVQAADAEVTTGRSEENASSRSPRSAGRVAVSEAPGKVVARPQHGGGDFRLVGRVVPLVRAGEDDRSDAPAAGI